MVSKRALLAAAAVMTVLGAPAIAGAQSMKSELQSAQAGQSNFSRDRNIAVVERKHPEYEAAGLRLGAFFLFPKLTTAAETNSNIYGVSAGEQSDVIVHVQPDFSLESGWSRHALNVYGGASLNRYLDYDGENSDDWKLGVAGRLDIQRNASLSAGLETREMTEARTSTSSPAAAASPITYATTLARLAGVYEFNRLKLSGGVESLKYDYEDGRTTLGAVVDQDDRDRTVTQITGRADYAVSPDTAFFLQATSNERDYRMGIPAIVDPKDSSGYTVLVGANFELSNLVRGEIAAGYLSQDYDQVVYKDVDGFGARAEVEWFVTPLATVTVSGARSVEDSGIVGAAGYLSNSGQVKIDYEAMRNVIVTGRAGYSTDDFQGIDRTDDRWDLGLSADYLLNRNVGISVGYSFQRQESAGAVAGTDFDVQKAAVALTLQF